MICELRDRGSRNSENMGYGEKAKKKPMARRVLSQWGVYKILPPKKSVQGKVLYESKSTLCICNSLRASTKTPHCEYRLLRSPVFFWVNHGHITTHYVTILFGYFLRLTRLTRWGHFYNIFSTPLKKMDSELERQGISRLKPPKTF